MDGRRPWAMRTPELRWERRWRASKVPRRPELRQDAGGDGGWQGRTPTRAELVRSRRSKLYGYVTWLTPPGLRDRLGLPLSARISREHPKASAGVGGVRRGTV